MTRLRGKRDGQHGGATVEFALVLPIAVALIFGMVDYGWYFYQKFSFASAVREGVRYGTKFRDDPLGLPANQPDVKAHDEAVRRCQMGSVPTAGLPGATLTASLQGAFPRRAVKIDGAYTFQPLVGIVRMPSTAMTYQMQMLLEQQF